MSSIESHVTAGTATSQHSTARSRFSWAGLACQFTYTAFPGPCTALQVQGLISMPGVRPSIGAATWLIMTSGLTFGITTLSVLLSS